MCSFSAVSAPLAGADFVLTFPGWYSKMNKVFEPVFLRRKLWISGRPQLRPGAMPETA